MSGLCGWFSHEPAAVPIDQMAAPLYRFGAPPLQVGEHGAGALALAVGAGNGSLLHEEGLLVAVWGERAETVARLWRSHGAKACAALSGSFAFAILDERRDEALLAVDRCGTRPMFYQQVGRSLLFASCADALVRHPGAGSELDPQALFHYLHFHAVPAPAAIYKGQRRLLPGEAVHLQGGRLQRTRYWQLQFHEHGQADPAQLKQEFLDTARHAAQDARGALPAGVLLSGGQGSALIAAMLAGAGAPLRTYAVGYDGGADDSLAHARQLAHQLGAIHRERQVGAADVADAIAQLAALCDQPLGDPALLVPLHGALMAREDGVQRLLGGHGCAELFGARPEYAVQARLSQYEKIPSALRQALVEPLLFQLAGAADAAPLRRARSYIERALVGLPARLAASNLLHEHAGADLFDAGFLASVDPSAPAWLLGQSWSKTERCSQVNQLIALELQYGLADQRLPAMRRACQLAGLEAGFPLLGDAMVAFAARLAPRQKLDGMRRCPFLREALRGSAAHKASAQAAVLPFGLWLHSAPRIRALAFDSLAALKRRAIVRPGFIDALLAAHPAAPAQRHAGMVWLLMMLEQWLAQRGAGARPAAPVRRAVDASATCRL